MIISQKPSNTNEQQQQEQEQEQEQEQKKDEKNKPFRLAAKKLLLTYSRTDISRQDVLKQLQSLLKNDIKEYYIVQENHLPSNDEYFTYNEDDIRQIDDIQNQKSDRDNSHCDNNNYEYVSSNKDSEETNSANAELCNTHIHAFLHLNNKANIRNSSALDLVHPIYKHIIHGNYLTVRDEGAVCLYLKKEDQTPLTNFKENFKLKLKQIANEQGYHFAMNYYELNRPIEFMEKFNQISSNISAYCKRKPKFALAKYNVDSFNYPKDIIKWFESEDHKKTLLIQGPTEYGKTQGILALLNKLGHRVLRVANVNSLKAFNSSPNGHDTLLFDDFDWTDITRDTKIALLDKDQIADVRVLYGMTEIPPNVLKIVMCNSADTILNKPFSNEIDPALQRRVNLVQLKKTLIKDKDKDKENENEKNQHLSHKDKQLYQKYPELAKKYPNISNTQDNDPITAITDPLIEL